MVQDRLTQLDQKLQEDAIDLILMEADQVARLVPRRNIETWILCLNGTAVDEEIDYKRTRNDWAELIRPATDALYTWSRPSAQIPDYLVPSLRHGIAIFVDCRLSVP